MALRLDTLAGKVAGAEGEGGLKIVPADGAVQVEQPPGHKQSRHSLALHGAGIDLVEGDAAGGDFRLLEAKRSGGADTQPLDGLNKP